MFIAAIVEAFKCDFGTNINNRWLILQLSPIFITRHNGQPIKVEQFCNGGYLMGSSTVSSGLSMKFGNCISRPQDYVKITVGSQSETCLEYGQTRIPMALTLGTDTEYTITGSNSPPPAP